MDDKKEMLLNETGSELYNALDKPFDFIEEGVRRPLSVNLIMLFGKISVLLWKRWGIMLRRPPLFLMP